MQKIVNILVLSILLFSGFVMPVSAETCENNISYASAKTAETIENAKFLAEQESQNVTFQAEYTKVRNTQNKIYDLVIVVSNSANYEIDNKVYEGCVIVKKSFKESGKTVITKLIQIKEANGGTKTYTLNEMLKKYDAIKAMQKSGAPITFNIDGSEGTNIKNFIENY